jgi:hypothetical protein
MGVRLFDQVLSSLDAGIAPSTPQESTLATWEPAFAPTKLADKHA